ncbi:MAG: hypothetical protein HYY68_09235 [Thaumarchaeota archaeon]|nr:hypothetical protein [Nitrososphaerota archaeon]
MPKTTEAGLHRASSEPVAPSSEPTFNPGQPDGEARLKCVARRVLATER